MTVRLLLFSNYDKRQQLGKLLFGQLRVGLRGPWGLVIQLLQLLQSPTMRFYASVKHKSEFTCY